MKHMATSVAVVLSTVTLLLSACSDDGDDGGGGSSGSGGQTASGGSGGRAGAANAGTSSGGSSASGGSGGGQAGNSGVSGSGGGSAGNPNSKLGTGTMEGSDSSTAKFQTGLVSRDGVPYAVITNGWGPGWGSHSISWNGTSFTVESTEGEAGMNGEPASYPAVFCGRYSVRDAVPDCGLPRAISEINSLRTGWRWAANGNAGSYNAAYDIWVGNGTALQQYLMVWLRDPPNFRPAGDLDTDHQNVTVANVPGVWDIWHGSVNGRPIINWVRPSGQESSEIEFDVMDFVRDAQERGLSITGTHINSVAVGFEIWEGPIDNLQSLDFYVEVE